MWIVPCLEGATPTRTSGSSTYPAVQNMLLAARALGLGATLTTLYLQFEKEAEAALWLAAERPLLCPAAHRLPNGAVWASPSYPAHRYRLRGSVGSALPFAEIACMSEFSTTAPLAEVGTRSVG